MSDSLKVEHFVLLPADPLYPQGVRSFFDQAPPVTAIGNVEILAAAQKTGFLCSRDCPGHLILKIHDEIRNMRDHGRVVVGGFHSPLEKEALSILLRGKQSVITCPARSIAGFRIPVEWKGPLEQGRMLVLSPFPSDEKRMTRELAEVRNTFVVALADEVFAPHQAPNGGVERVVNLALERGKRVYRDKAGGLHE